MDEHPIPGPQIDRDAKPPDDLDANEIRCEGEIHVVNGWEAGQLAQQMGAQIRRSLKPGAKVIRAIVRVSVWLEGRGGGA